MGSSEGKIVEEMNSFKGVTVGIIMLSAKGSTRT